MQKPFVLALGGIPDSNLAEVRSWSPNGVDLLFDGNVTDDALARNEAIDFTMLMVGGSRPPKQIPLQRRPDLLFNLICNPEASRKALAFAEKLSAGLARDGVRTLNPPDLVRATARSAAPRFFDGLDLVHMPQARLLESPSMRALTDQLEAGVIRYPLIVRTTADHNGDNMVRVDSEADLQRLERLPFDGRDYYVIPFVEYRSSDGLYRKFRLLKIGDRFIPRHRIVSRQWKVHASQRSEEENATPEEMALEQRYREDPKGFLGDALYEQLIEGLSNTQLDFVGVDFGLLDDGSAVVFECNGCTNAGVRDATADKSPLRAMIIDRIEAAFQEVVMAAVRDADKEGT